MNELDQKLREISKGAKLRLEHQVAAFDWLIGQCEDQFVRAWIIQKRELTKSAGGTPVTRDEVAAGLEER